MQIVTTSGWDDYALLDSGNGLRLEKFGKYTLVRPDPQILWKPHLKHSEWEKADAICQKVSDEKGNWTKQQSMPDKWLMKYNHLSFYCRLTPFKHTGVFPEQSMQWDWIEEKITAAKRPIRVLNLFAYTGISTLAAAHAGGQVTHVDASVPSMAWAKDNQKASGLENKAIRWILDDVTKFCEKEIRRGAKYDAIIMDPPIYGHGPNGERWKFAESFPKLMEVIHKLLSPDPLFVLINAYAISASSLMLENILRDYLPTRRGEFSTGELAIQEEGTGRLLSTGIFSNWSANK
jgi:23S rRNA (cytosine1962-C5)-methyltransferase